MQLQKVRLLRLMSKIALGFLAMGALFWIVGVTWAPSWIKESIEQYSQKVGYHLELQGIVVKPFALKVELRGLKLKKIQGKELFSLDRGMLSVQWSKLVVGEISIDAIELDGPSVLFERDAKENSKWNWLEFVEKITAKRAGSEEVNTSAPKVFIESLTIREARLKINDAQTTFTDDLGPFSLSLKKLSNYSSKSDQPGLEGLYELDLGKVDILIPALNKMVVFEKVHASGELTNPDQDRLEAKLNLKLDAGVLDFIFNLEPKQNMIRLDVAIDNLSLAPIVNLLPANSPLQTTSGVLSGKLQYQTRQDLWSTVGDLSLKNVEITEGRPKQAFMKWRQADLKQIDLRRLVSGKTALTIDELT
jgi:hypothetical protein